MIVKLQLGNVHKIDMHIRVLEEIRDTKNLSLSQEITMNDTIGIFRGIKSELEKRGEYA